MQHTYERLLCLSQVTAIGFMGVTPTNKRRFVALIGLPRLLDSNAGDDVQMLRTYLNFVMYQEGILRLYNKMLRPKTFIDPKYDVQKKELEFKSQYESLYVILKSL